VTTALILPGLDGDASLRQDFAAKLAPDFDSSLPGYPPGLAGGYPGFLELAETALPRDRKFVIVGESFSGPLAIQLAAARPPGLAGLVLCASFAVHPLSSLGAITPVLPALPPRMLPDAALRYFLLGRWSTPAHLARLRDSIRRLAPSALRARLVAAASVDCRPLLARIEVPILCLQATGDRVVRASAARALKAHCPAVEVRRVEGPHALLLTSPEACAWHVKDWFQARNPA
jgi:pimeloyl-ACP methyl ester carboxylesterase